MSRGPHRRTKVLFLNTATLPPLGADTWIHARIMERLDRSTHELVAACVFGADGAPTPTYAALREIPDLELVDASLGTESASRRARGGRLRGLLEIGPAIWTILRLAWLIRRRGISIIHTSDRPRDAFAAVLLGRMTGARSLVHVHVAYDAGWMGRLLRWSLAHADGLVAVSAFVARTLMDAGIDPRRVHVVLNGIEPGAWHSGAGAASARADLGLATDTPVLLTVCRLFPGKGAGDVIEAIGPLRHEHPDVTLLVVGTDVTPGGRYSAQLHDRVAELGVAEHVRFLGRRADIEGIMAAADLFVMPSHHEPFGLVFCEAMAMERPVVALDDGGTVEVVEHGRTGLLSRRGDVAALVGNLERLLGDQAERAAMGAAGRRAVLERFTASRMAHDVALVYQHYPARVEGWRTHIRLGFGTRGSSDGGHGRAGRTGQAERGDVPPGDGHRRLHGHTRRRGTGSTDAGRQRADR